MVQVKGVLRLLVSVKHLLVKLLLVPVKTGLIPLLLAPIRALSRLSRILVDPRDYLNLA